MCYQNLMRSKIDVFSPIGHHAYSALVEYFNSKPLIVNSNPSIIMANL